MYQQTHISSHVYFLLNLSCWCVVWLMPLVWLHMLLLYLTWFAIESNDLCLEVTKMLGYNTGSCWIQRVPLRWSVCTFRSHLTLCWLPYGSVVIYGRPYAGEHRFNLTTFSSALTTLTWCCIWHDSYLQKEIIVITTVECTSFIFICYCIIGYIKNKGSTCNWKY